MLVHLCFTTEAFEFRFKAFGKCKVLTWEIGNRFPSSVFQHFSHKTLLSLHCLLFWSLHCAILIHCVPSVNLFLCSFKCCVGILWSVGSGRKKFIGQIKFVCNFNVADRFVLKMNLWWKVERGVFISLNLKTATTQITRAAAALTTAEYRCLFFRILHCEVVFICARNYLTLSGCSICC